MKSNKEVLLTFGKHVVRANEDLTGVVIDNNKEQLLLDFLYELVVYLETDKDLKNNIESVAYYENYIEENQTSKKKPLALISGYEILQNPLEGYLYIRNMQVGKINGIGRVGINIDLIYAIVDKYPTGLSL